MELQRYRRKVVLLMLAVLLTGCFTHVAMADFGPKPSVDLKVVNAPQEEYYIALLTVNHGSQEKENTPLHLDTPVDESRVKAYLEDFLFEGYYYWDVTCRYKKGFGTQTYAFHYRAPEDFRVIVIRLDGTVAVSEKHHRENFKAICTYDFVTGTITEEAPAKSETGGVYFWCFILTLLNELVVLWMFRFPLTGGHLNTLIVIGVNLLTNLPFSIYLMNANPGNLVIVVIILECVITAVECLIYSVALVNKEGKKDCKRSIAYGVVANLLSALTMLIH